MTSTMILCNDKDNIDDDDDDDDDNDHNDNNDDDEREEMKEEEEEETDVAIDHLPVTWISLTTPFISRSSRHLRDSLSVSLAPQHH